MAGFWAYAWTRRGLLLGAASAGLLIDVIGPHVIREIERALIDPAELERRAQAIGRRHGLRIGYGAPETFYVPPYTAADTKRPGMSMTTVEPVYLAPVLEGIETGLAAYPSGVFPAVCQAIFVCGDLRFEGEPAGGTYGPAWIVIASSALGGGSSRIAQKGLHHEFSSFIWNRNWALRAAWESALPADWKPALTVHTMLNPPESDERLLDQGFLRPYGATTSENDFNTYAEALFLDPARLAKLAARLPVVARKAALLLSVYGDLDARMADVFAKLGVDHLQNPDAWQIDITIRPAPDGTIEIR